MRRRRSRERAREGSGALVPVQARRDPLGHRGRVGASAAGRAVGRRHRRGARASSVTPPARAARTCSRRHVTDEGALVSSMRREWAAEGVCPTIGLPRWQGYREQAWHAERLLAGVPTVFRRGRRSRRSEAAYEAEGTLVVRERPDPRPRPAVGVPRLRRLRQGAHVVAARARGVAGSRRDDRRRDGARAVRRAARRPRADPRGGHRRSRAPAPRPVVA